jgi:3D (Asp-Asp-Asp) domain-containing protein
MINKRRFILAIIFIILFCFTFCFATLFTYFKKTTEVNIDNIKSTFKHQEKELNKNIEEYKEALDKTQQSLNELEKIVNEFEILNSKLEKAPVFKATAYTLSVNSCGKTKVSRGYGITRNGTDLRGHTLYTARTIAVDPSVIPLNKSVYVKFLDEKYSKYTGIYNSNDTGSKVKGNHIDVFYGDFDSEEESKEALNFGVTKVKVIILE